MNQLYRHIKVPVNTTNPNIHVYRFSDFDEHSLLSMQPHTKSFHQISFITGFGKSQLNINKDEVNRINSVLYFISPKHIYSWVRDKRIDGFILNFKQEFLPIKPLDFQKQFSFFNLAALNAVPIEIDEESRVLEIFEELFTQYHQTDSAFSDEILKHYLQVLLYKCLSLYQKRRTLINELPQEQGLLIRFQNLVNNHYLEKRSIKEYADLLSITPNHLSESIKKYSNKNALAHINERILLEAKNLLIYGTDDIKGIAYTLNFASPSHFGKFFKKHMGQTPLQYRNERLTKK